MTFFRPEMQTINFVENCNKLVGVYLINGVLGCRIMVKLTNEEKEMLRIAICDDDQRELS